MAAPVVWITALAGTLDARQQVITGSSHSAPGCSLPAAAAPSPVGCAPARAHNSLLLLGSVGRKALAIAGVLLRILLKTAPGRMGRGTPLVFAIDDSPTQAVRAARRGR